MHLAIGWIAHHNPWNEESMHPGTRYVDRIGTSMWFINGVYAVTNAHVLQFSIDRQVLSFQFVAFFRSYRYLLQIDEKESKTMSE